MEIKKEARAWYFWEKMLGRKDLWQRLLENLSAFFWGIWFKTVSIITHLEMKLAKRVALKSGFSLFVSLKEVIAIQENVGLSWVSALLKEN